MARQATLMGSTCPKCGAVMAPFEHDGVTVDLCPSCKGIWFDAGELQRVIGGEAPLGAPASMELGGGPSASCPRCQQPLSERRMAEDGALLVLACNRCGGVFLERGELARIQRLARRPRHLSAQDQRAVAASAPDARGRRKVHTDTWEKIRAYTAIKPRARAQWQSFSTAGGRMFLYLLGLPTEEDNPVRGVPFVCYALILFNLVIWLFQDYGMGVEASCQMYGMVPIEVLQGHRLWTLWTSEFVHGGWWHLIGNMYFLWLFGDNVEDRIGHWGFLILYLLAGAGAQLLTLLESSTLALPHVGASGAIAGIMAAYMVLFPGARIMAVFFSFILWAYVVPVPAWLYLAFWLALQALGVFSHASGIAWWAHIGGFGVGILGAALFRMASAPPASPSARAAPA